MSEQDEAIETDEDRYEEFKRLVWDELQKADLLRLRSDNFDEVIIVREVAADDVVKAAASAWVTYVLANDARVRREAAADQREKDYAAVIAVAPPINAELNPTTGAEDDPVMSAYVEGFRDAAAAIREQGIES